MGPLRHTLHQIHLFLRHRPPANPPAPPDAAVVLVAVEAAMEEAREAFARDPASGPRAVLFLADGTQATLPLRAPPLAPEDAVAELRPRALAARATVVLLPDGAAGRLDAVVECAWLPERDACHVTWHFAPGPGPSDPWRVKSIERSLSASRAPLLPPRTPAR